MRIPRERPENGVSQPDQSSSPSHREQRDKESPVRGTGNGTNARVRGSPFQSPSKISAEHPPFASDPVVDGITSQLDIKFAEDLHHRKELRSLSPYPSWTSTTEASSITASSLYNATPRPSPSPEASLDAEVIGMNSGDYDGLSEHMSPTKTSDLPSIGRLILDKDDDPYDIREEPLPDEPYFDHNFQLALKSATDLAGKIRETLGRCTLAENLASDLSRLLATARKLEHHDSPESRTIGIIGDSASGSSIPICSSP